MGKYNWTIKDIEKTLKKIEYLLQTETDKEKRELLLYDSVILMNHIDDFYLGDNYNEIGKLLDNYVYAKDELSEIKFLWSDLKRFKQIVTKPINVPNLKIKPLTYNKMLELTHDFYKTLDPYFFNLFLKCFKDRDDHIRFQRRNKKIEYLGESILIPSLQETYIDIFLENNLEDVLTVIHEYAHATSILINPFHIRQTKILFSEVESIFMELIGTDFLDKIFKNDFGTIIKANKINGNLNFADNLVNIIRLIEAEKNIKKGYFSNKSLKLIAKNDCNLEAIEVDNILNNAEITAIPYLISYMYALELYKLYKVDPEKSLYILRKIIELNRNSEEEYYNIIKSFGLHPNDCLNKYYKKVERDALTLTRKKSKPNT